MASLRLAAVKPGLTGPWRLTGPQASRSDQALRDLAYIRDYTIWEDLRILWISLGSLWGARDEAPLARWECDDTVTPPVSLLG